MFKATESEPLPPAMSREDIYEKLAEEADRGLGLTEAEAATWFEKYGPDLKAEVEKIGACHPDSQRFHELLTAIGGLHDRKQSTYGRPDSPFSNYMSAQELGIAPWRYVVARVCEKISRLQTFANMVVNTGDMTSSTKRELMDIAACSLIAIVLLEKATGNKI